MNKIERLEKWLIEWKANKECLKAAGVSITVALGIIDGLESDLALAIAERLPNTQMQTEACKRNSKECQFYDGVGCAGVPTLCTGRPR